MLNRNELPDVTKWNLKDIFNTEQDFLDTLESIKKSIVELSDIREEFISFPFDKNEETVDYLIKFKELMLISTNKITNCYVYANLLVDSEKTITRSLELKNMITVIYEEYSIATNFTSVMKDWSDDLLLYLANNPKYINWKKSTLSFIKNKQRCFDENTETLIDLATITQGGFSDAADNLLDCDLPSPKIEIDGEIIDLDKSAFLKYIYHSNQDVRERVFNDYHNNLNKYRNVLATLLHNNILADTKNSKMRKYNSSLERSLDRDDITEDIYPFFINKVKSYLPKLHEYLKVKKTLLGVDELKYSDLYADMTNTKLKEYDYKEAKQIIIDSVRVLGEEYVEVFEKAFNEQWIDLYPNKNKSGGAYMQGGAYDIHPYILMNYLNRFNDVSTLGHELGHAAHSYLSNKNQHVNLARYSTFIAEIASTTVEILINKNMLLSSNENTSKKIYSNLLENFRTTVFRQTMFAEFEMWMHSEIELGKSLNPEALENKYLSLVKEYYGHDSGIVYVQDSAKSEWSRIPHFYNSFYVWKYATSFLNSVTFSSRIIDGDITGFLELLKSGSSDYPIQLLNKAGIDFLKNDLYDESFKFFDDILDKLK